MVHRHAILALGSLLVGAGCHAGLSGRSTRPEPPPIARETVTVKNFIELHNRNASAVRTLTAAPRIEVAGEGRRARVNGLMAMERPRGFRLELRGPATVGDVADLGSNDREFWFWVKDNPDKAIFVCDYKDVEASQLAVTYQPDWIVEALGLREIDPREARTIAAKPGDQPDQLVLTQARKDNRGEMLTKETVVNQKTGHIIEHRLWAGAKRDLLAKATISQYAESRMLPTEENPEGATIQLPAKFRLDWVAEKFALDVTMSDVKVNKTFAPEKRTALFTEPTIPNTTRRDLAQAVPAPTSTSKIYETDPRSGVRLGRPEPVPSGVDGAIRARNEPRPPSADYSSLAAPPAGVIGAPIPRGADPEALRASATRQSWRPALLSR